MEVSATEGVIHVKCASCVGEGLGFGCTKKSRTLKLIFSFSVGNASKDIESTKTVVIHKGKSWVLPEHE